MQPAESAARKNPLGPVGGYVIENLTRLREARRLSYRELSDRLERLGRPIPTLGLSRIEKGERRVDADDLVALAVALDVNPTALLLPRTDTGDDQIELAPARRETARVAWKWADGRIPLPRHDEITHLEQADFEKQARPPWDVADGGPQSPIFRQIRDRQIAGLQQEQEAWRAELGQRVEELERQLLEAVAAKNQQQDTEEGK